MHAKVQKWGNSLGVRIPQAIAKRLNLHSGAQVEVNAKNNQMIISKSKSELDIMLDEINDKNCHHLALENNDKLGNESW